MRVGAKFHLTMISTYNKLKNSVVRLGTGLSMERLKSMGVSVTRKDSRAELVSHIGDLEQP